MCAVKILLLNPCHLFGVYFFQLCVHLKLELKKEGMNAADITVNTFTVIRNYVNNPNLSLADFSDNFSRTPNF